MRPTSGPDFVDNGAMTAPYTPGPDLVTHTLAVNGVRIHAVEATTNGAPGAPVGSGRLVLFVHGFPESWLSWRHQLPAVAAAGWRAVAIDVRGYGRSSRPEPIEAYRMTEVAADNAAVVEALGEPRAVIIGHDWGSPIAFNSVLLHPESFRALGLLSVPYAPRGNNRPSVAFRAMGDAVGEEFYIEYFQQPGRPEAEIEPDVRHWLAGFYVAASGDAPPMAGPGTIATIPAGARMRDRFSVPAQLPAWLDDAFELYVAEFEHTGLTGGLNRYRNADRDWEDLERFAGRPIDVPALFIGGDRDGPTMWGAQSIANFPATLPRLWRSVILPGCGHWTQQERPAEVNQHLTEFLAGFGD